VLGGPMNVYEHARHPWLADETAFIGEALRAGKSVLGLCLGAQLMAVALGGHVAANAHREIGWGPVETVPEARADARALCFPARFTTFHWHGDTFSLPAGAVWLFRSEACAHQGFAWGERAVGLQFHPEITAEAVEAWIEVARKTGGEGGGDLRPGPYVQTAAAMRDGAGARAGLVAANNLWVEKLCAVLTRRPA
jgi:GMP synthase-like glutamine amidotransferase